MKKEVSAKKQFKQTVMEKIVEIKHELRNIRKEMSTKTELREVRTIVERSATVMDALRQEVMVIPVWVRRVEAKGW